jgi:hypothetical protein
MIIVLKLTIFNYYFVQPPDTFKKVANCVNYKTKKLKQSNFERNTKKILDFEEHFSSQIHDIKKFVS